MSGPCSRSEFTNGQHAWGPNGQCSFCGATLPVLNSELGVAIDGRTATIQRLAAALKECADELEAEIEARYPAERRAQYPTYQAKYERDMQTVVDALAAYKASRK